MKPIKAGHIEEYLRLKAAEEVVVRRRLELMKARFALYPPSVTIATAPAKPPRPSLWKRIGNALWTW